MRPLGDVLIDGKRFAADEATIAVFDIGLLRGYGCFEALRAYRGKPFRMPQHLDRLETSARALRVPAPDRAALEDWVRECAAEGGDCVVRVVVTGGTSLRNPGTGSRVVVFAEGLPALPPTLRVQPRTAPWHSDGATSELTGAKTLSYAPNIAAGLAAQRDGFDDALLLGRSGEVLEGPTYSVGWVVDGVMHTPSLDLGILGSITRGATLEIAATASVEVVEGRFRLSDLEAADEAFAMSTVKEVMPITEIGDVRVEVGPVARRLGSDYHDLVRAELAL